MFSAKHLKKSIGETGEENASKYLIRNGYKILERNYRYKSDEIDIIAKDKNGCLIVFEVKSALSKTSRTDDTLDPERNFTKTKIERLKRISKMFVAKHPKLINSKEGWRVDLLAIVISHKKITIRHYKNAIHDAAKQKPYL